MKRTVLEKQIQREIEADLGALPDLLLLRNSVGVAHHISDEGKEYVVPYGLGDGSPDLVCVLLCRPSAFHLASKIGVWFCLEVKTPEDPNPRPNQMKCREQWEAFGVLWYVVTSRQEARAALEDARGRVRA